MHSMPAIAASACTTTSKRVAPAKAREGLFGCSFKGLNGISAPGLCKAGWDLEAHKASPKPNLQYQTDTPLGLCQ